MFVKPAADPEEKQSVEETQAMIGKAWDVAVNYNSPKVLNVDVNRIEKK